MIDMIKRGYCVASYGHPSSASERRALCSNATSISVRCAIFANNVVCAPGPKICFGAYAGFSAISPPTPARSALPSTPGHPRALQTTPSRPPGQEKAPNVACLGTRVRDLVDGRGA